MLSSDELPVLSSDSEPLSAKISAKISSFLSVSIMIVGRAPARQSGGRKFKSRSSKFFFVHPNLFKICTQSVSLVVYYIIFITGSTMAANRMDVCVEPPQFLSTLDKRIQTVLLKIELSPAIPIKTLLASDFTLDKLLEARNTIFEAAKDKYRERSNVQHGHGDKATMPNIANFTMKARRSNETVADAFICLITEMASPNHA